MSAMPWDDSEKQMAESLKEFYAILQNRNLYRHITHDPMICKLTSPGQTVYPLALHRTWQPDTMESIYRVAPLITPKRVTYAYEIFDYYSPTFITPAVPPPYSWHSQYEVVLSNLTASSPTAPIIIGYVMPVEQYIFTQEFTKQFPFQP